ncbi:MAG: DNA-protecting protein DprA [Alphaproteobacteria bacterium]|nr:DNA-protecting protein DprA [Alphaproteobacteria bacterium]
MRTVSSLASEPLVDVLRLIRTPNIGPVTFFALIDRFGGVGAALDALPELAKRGGKAKPLVAASVEDAQKEIDATEKFGARMIVYGAPEYPAHLLNISDPPPIISVLGNPAIWSEKKLVAMVGARNASANGCQFAQKLAKELGENGFIVVSGLARGIDSFAHRGALATGTVGVIAGGIDNIYPPENAPLFEQMKNTGAIISELPFATLPFAGSFPGRNRIIAGMTLGTLVVEASPKSGSLITARFALENNREVMAIPGSPLDPRSRGGNQLIKQGATLVENTQDILQALSHIRSDHFSEDQRDLFDHAPAQKISHDELQTLLLEKLSITPVAVDELIEQCAAPAGDVLTGLLELELAGRIRRSAGNKVCISGEMDDVA